MGNYWKCKNCGKINMDYVGTCACGGLKSDGEAATEEEYKNQVPEKDIPPNNKRKWKCPNCSRVNQGDFCSCGYVKSRFVERFPELSVFFKACRALYDEMICIFHYFCPCEIIVREIREISF